MPTDGTGHTAPTTADLLRERLGEALPMDRIVVDLLADALDEMRCDLLPVSGKPLGEVLLSPTTNLSVLQTIKDHGKQLASRPGCSESEREVGLAIYFTAIASALVLHGQKISTHPYETLTRSFSVLIEKPWIAPEVSELLARAQEVCRQRQR